jgi:class 3 adenylate cyclase
MTTRRLAAIIAADVAGYSRLMHADEEGTHAAFIAIMTGAVEPAIAQHVGRIVKNTGDGFISEFPSAVEAVRCAVQFQDTITRGSAGNPTAPQLRLRVGINLSDVIIEPHDIFGDGVNIAARLEGLAEPGGILISAAVHEQVRGRIPCRFEDLGEQQVRNIAAPVRVYRVLPAAESAQAPALQDGRARLSIAVLPFLNLSQDGDLDYVVDGIVDNLITDLSRALPGSFVISRSTAFTYKGRHVPIRQIGEELGVRYILEAACGRMRPACASTPG